MKIAKYLFLLLLLTTATVAVFVATKDGSYFVQKSKIIAIPKEKVFDYVSDFKNWGEFYQLKKEDASIAFQYSSNPIGIKSFLTWKSITTNGKIKSSFVLENDSIAQDFISNGEISEMHWKFKDTLKSTKVTWSTSGKMSFKDKFYALFWGGTKNKMNSFLEKSLDNLNTILTTEVNTFKIDVEGFVEHDTIFYLQSLAFCKVNDLPLIIKSKVPKLIKLASSTDTEIKGSPFVVYHEKDSLNNTIRFSIAIPTKSKVYTSEGSDIVTGQIMPFQAIKGTLDGDYSHKEELMRQIYQFMDKSRLERNNKYKVLEILRKSSATDKSPTKWITDVYVPVKLKKIVVKVKPVTIDSINTITNSVFNDTTR